MLSLEPESPHAGETMQLTIENTTRLLFEFGVGYRLERREASRWRWVNRDAAFILLLKFLQPHGREQEEIVLPDHLEPGRYRIVKAFTAPAADRTIRATVEFRVS